MTYSIKGNIVDVLSKRIFKGTIYIEGTKVKNIIEEDNDSNDFILPGLIDAHVHIESSMLTPSEFAKAAVAHGTVATVSDPHEIANVLGVDGIEFMIENANTVPFKFYFGAPSCVPASPFETSGAKIGVEATEKLLAKKDIYYLAEMMNFPGVLFKDQEVMGKLEAAKKFGKPIDGHAPGLTGEDAEKYAGAGISTDHECFTIEEAIDKIEAGMTIQIREGSAAKNFNTLMPLINSLPEYVMLCSDDKHPDDLVEGHINKLVKRGIQKGIDIFNLLRSVTVNPIKHYKLDVGLLQKGDLADLIIVDSLKDFNIKATYINGTKVSEKGKPLFESPVVKPINKFFVNNINLDDLKVEAQSDTIKAIKAIDGQLITELIETKAKIENNQIIQDTENDILKIVVLNRYKNSKPSIGFIKNFGLQKGAIASTVAHDSHNIIAVGANDEDILRAINLLNDSKGGVAAIDAEHYHVLPLPIAGIMGVEDAQTVANKYKQIDNFAKKLGCTLSAPFMTLSFMALLVIPELKLSDQGLFDGNKFEFTSLFPSKV